jgi:hypothetical protein
LLHIYSTKPMPLPLIVKWIKQTGEHHPPHQRVTHIGGRAGQVAWEHALPLAVEYVEKNIFTYFVVIAEQWQTLEIGRTAHGDKYLKLVLEEDGLEKLLSLAPKSDPASPQPPEAQSARSVQNQT